MKGLRVPVRLYGKGIYHDTDYLRGAESREEANAINALAGKDSYAHVSYVMEEVEPFTATLSLMEVYHHKSSAYVTFTTPDGGQYPAFMTDLIGILGKATMTKGWLAPATYEVCKRGANSYGIRRAKHDTQGSR